VTRDSVGGRAPTHVAVWWLFTIEGAVGSEAAGFQQGSGDVVGEVAEAECAAAQVFQAAVDGFGGAVAGAGPVEVGEHVGGAAGQGPAEGDDLAQRGRDAAADRGDQFLHELAPGASVRFAVGGDHPLVDAPGRFDLRVLVRGEQFAQALSLLVSEQAGTGV
jgi:hypothetical protein